MILSSDHPYNDRFKTEYQISSVRSSQIALAKKNRPLKREQLRFIFGRSHLCDLLVAFSDEGICAVELGQNRDELFTKLQARFESAHLIEDNNLSGEMAVIKAYFKNPTRDFALSLDIRGSQFQKKVWKELCKIPCGSTLSYRHIAREMGIDSAARAVARACATNATALIIPCHRVIKSTGELAGYAWGLEIKKKFLNMKNI